MTDPLDSSKFSSPPDLNNLAIEAALNCDWNKAEKLNRLIIKEDPKNIACLNRLGRTLIELGKYPQAKKIYQTVLDLDPYNTIAQKNFKKIQSFKKNDLKSPISQSANHLGPVASPSFFLEEAGITKAVTLLKVAEPQKLLRLYAGDLVNLVTKNRGITVTDSDNNYLGVLPDDISHLLLKLIKGGNRYQALIKSVKQSNLTILIREIFRSRRFKNQPSFLDNSYAFTFPSDNITLPYDDSRRGDMDGEESDEPAL